MIVTQSFPKESILKHLLLHREIIYNSFFKEYVPVDNSGYRSSGYGEIECKGNETKLEKCIVRKDIRQNCQTAAVASHCSDGKICDISMMTIHACTHDVDTSDVVSIMIEHACVEIQIMLVS